MICSIHTELDCLDCGQCEPITYIDSEGEEKELTDEEVFGIEEYELGR